MGLGRVGRSIDESVSRRSCRGTFRIISSGLVLLALFKRCFTAL
jgi:hypothetical protein